MPGLTGGLTNWLLGWLVTWLNRGGHFRNAGKSKRFPQAPQDCTNNTPTSITTVINDPGWSVFAKNALVFQS